MFNRSWKREVKLWRGRAYEQRERADKLEDRLAEIVSITKLNPVLKSVIDLKTEVEKAGKIPTKVFLGQREFYELGEILAPSFTRIPEQVVSTEKLYGLTVYVSAKEGVRVE